MLFLFTQFLLMSNNQHRFDGIQPTLLSPVTTRAIISKLCNHAVTMQAEAICVAPMFVKFAKQKLANSNVKVATVVGYPFGYAAVEAKLAEILLCLVDGADDILMAINYTAVKNEDWLYVANEINHLLPVVQKAGMQVSIIFNHDYLQEDDIVKCCNLYAPTGIKTFLISLSEPANNLEFMERLIRNFDAGISFNVLADGVDVATAELFLANGIDKILCSNYEDFMVVNGSK